MKNIILSIICVLSINISLTQVQFCSTYGKSDIGWNYRVGVEYFPIKNISLGLGTRIISINDKESYDFFIYRDQFYPVKNAEYFGIYTTLNYYPLKNKKYLIQPFISYDFAYTKASLRWKRFFETYGSNDAPSGLYEIKTIYLNPLNAFEHYITVGFDVEIYNGLKITEKIGVGIAHFSGFDNNQQHVIAIAYPTDKYEFSLFFFNIGLKYDFNNLIKKIK